MLTYGFYATLLAGILWVVMAFLILLILIQKGKGGGLAGAFGGAGGQSAFGSRAGDAFTRVTIYTGAVWVLMIMLIIKLVQPVGSSSQSPVIQVPSGGSGAPIE